MDDGERIARMPRDVAPEAVQLAYQICVQGRADLALAPDEATGFTMTLLRLLAFEPAGGAAAATGDDESRASASRATRPSGDGEPADRAGSAGDADDAVRVRSTGIDARGRAAGTPLAPAEPGSHCRPIPRRGRRSSLA